MIICEKYILYGPQSCYQAHFDLALWPDFADRYNISPGSWVPVIRQSPERVRVADLLKWGLIPNRAKDPSIGLKLNNALGETVADKPSFRDSFKRRRCIVPASGFYEWHAMSAGKQPYYIRLKSDEPLAMAGLLESWRSPDGEVVRTFCIITTVPNAIMKPIHDRMPVLLKPDDYGRWLDSTVTASAIDGLVRRYPAELMEAWTVSNAVSRVTNEGAALIERSQVR